MADLTEADKERLVGKIGQWIGEQKREGETAEGLEWALGLGLVLLYYPQEHYDGKYKLTFTVAQEADADAR